ncbi:MAG: glycosyltransferase family 2 protein [Lachnospiraceae bacterium]|nr:glycosyltransferase family 2 protein [Lachnospiraceae bacterium]MCR5023068.1 glycosyltransferase family 2 protein [Lachnospiraceae bacterium]
MQDKLYIVIPAYNEEANIRQVVDEWYPIAVMAGESSRLVIVNDGSKDSTLSVLKEEQKTRPQLIVKDKENSGHGSTILAGYKFALSEGADYVFQTDSDGQTNPKEFEEFYRCRRHYDMVIGSRKSRQDGISRVFVTKILKFVVFLCFHVWVEDANTPFRLMKAETLKREIRYVPKDYFLTNVLLTVAFTKHQRSIRYIPITFRPRQGGVNSINMKRIFGIGKNALRDFVRLNRIL